MGERVIAQAARRTIGLERVPASDKIISVFEPHVDITINDWRETSIGHKLFDSLGKSGLIRDTDIQHGDPSDAISTVGIVERIVD